MEFSLPLAQDDCARLEQGHSVIKGVLAEANMSSVNAGDNLAVATCPFPVRVAGVRRYTNFRQLVLNEGLRNVLPGVATVADGVKVMQGSLPDAEVEEKGVLALVLEKARG